MNIDRELVRLSRNSRRLEISQLHPDFTKLSFLSGKSERVSSNRTLSHYFVPIFGNVMARTCSSIFLLRWSSSSFDHPRLDFILTILLLLKFLQCSHFPSNPLNLSGIVPVISALFLVLVLPFPECSDPWSPLPLSTAHTLARRSIDSPQALRRGISLISHFAPSNVSVIELWKSSSSKTSSKGGLYVQRSRKGANISICAVIDVLNNKPWQTAMPLTRHLCRIKEREHYAFVLPIIFHTVRA